MTYIVKNALLISLVLILTSNVRPVAANGDPGPPRDEYDANRFDARGYVNTYEDLLNAYYGEDREDVSQSHLAAHYHGSDIRVEAEGQTEPAAMVVEVVESISVEVEVEEVEPEPIGPEQIESVAAESVITEPIVTEPEPIEAALVEDIQAEEVPVEPEPVAELIELEPIEPAPIENIETETGQTELQTAMAVAETEELVQEAEPLGIETAAKVLVPTEIIEAIHAGTYSSGAFRNGHTTILPASGKAMYYNPGIMELVIAHRLEMDEIQLCEQCIGFAAMLLPGDLNRIVWIVLDDYTIEGPFLVVDMAAPHHVDGLIQRQWLIDVDYETAMRWGMNGPIWVTVVEHSLE